MNEMVEAREERLQNGDRELTFLYIVYIPEDVEINDIFSSSSLCFNWMLDIHC